MALRKGTSTIAISMAIELLGMARILSLDDCSVGLRNSLVRKLKSFDEAVLLPQAARDEQSGTFKNIAFRLHGCESNVSPDIFSPKWSTGISAIRIDSERLAKALADPETKQALMQKLKDAIPSETFDADLQVGPSLSCDEYDVDLEPWTAGFDGPSCFVGIFSAEHSRAPDVHLKGMNRTHATSYLVCKAGGGLASSMFHSRLTAALKQGKTLEEALEHGSPGPAALRRVTTAGSRNRARILLRAAEALGIPMLDSVPDTCSRGKYRCAVCNVDVTCNVLRKAENEQRTTYQYSASCVDTASSTGLITCSNLADGVILLLSASGDVSVKLRNDAHSTLPFATERLVSDKELIQFVTSAHKKAIADGEDCAHPDSAFIRSKFVWNNCKFEGTRDIDIEPLCLWGSHDREDFLAKFSRELGVATCQVVRLRPQLVCVAGMDSGKLRAAVKNISSAFKN